MAVTVWVVMRSSFNVNRHSFSSAILVICAADCVTDLFENFERMRDGMNGGNRGGWQVVNYDCFVE